MENKVIQYLQSLGFEIQPCSIPLNSKELSKRNFYLMIRSKSEKLFQFMNRNWPIKFKSERDDKSIWFVLRHETTKKVLMEIELKPKSDSKLEDRFQVFYYNFDYSKWKLRLYHGPSFAFMDGDDFFYLYADQDGFMDEIEYHLNQIPILKQLIREMKLKSILDGETNSKGF